jgi:hypothetical protein
MSDRAASSEWHTWFEIASARRVANDHQRLSRRRIRAARRERILFSVAIASTGLLLYGFYMILC